MDAMKATHIDDEREPAAGTPFPMPANASMVYIGDSMHMIEAVNYNDTTMLDDAGETHYTPLAFAFNKHIFHTAKHWINLA